MTEFLTPETKKEVSEKMQKWGCTSLDDTIREAFERIEAYRQLIEPQVKRNLEGWTEEEIKMELQKGLDSGDPTPLDIGAIKKEARKRWEQAKHIDANS